jgi:hypothetical protein
MSASNVIEAHNNYVQQLHGTNGMIEQYYQVALPELLQVRNIFFVSLRHTNVDKKLDYTRDQNLKNDTVFAYFL